MYPTSLQNRIDESTELWNRIDFSLKNVYRGLLFGPPGTGKTRAASLVGVNGNGIVRTMITPETCAAEVRGHYIMGPKGMEWLDGPGIQAWRRGARLVIDEIDMAGGDTIPLLHALLDDPEIAKISLSNGEEIMPGEDFTCVATMNSTPQALPPALLDRFTTVIEANLPNPGFLNKLPKAMRVAAAYAVYTDKKLVDNRIDQRLSSPRIWLAAARWLGRKSQIEKAFMVLGFTEDESVRIASAVKSHA